MSKRRPTWLRFVLCPLSFVLAGCGLSEYAGMMSSEAARVRQWDEETRLLGPPVKMPDLPKKKDKDGKDVEQRWSIFLRPPRGVSDTPTVVQASGQTQMFGPLVQYAAGSNTFGIRNVYLGVGVDQKEYVSTVFSQFGVTGGGETVTIPRSLTVLDSTAKSPSAEVTVKRKTVETDFLYSFNIYERDKVQVAVVFQMDKGNGAKADAAIKESLATLGEGDDVGRLDKLYQKMNRKPLKK
jgi:hypothetical protein